MENNKSELEDFSKILKECEKKLNDAQFELDNGDYVIKEYCCELRRQVQLAKEVKIYDLEQSSEQIIQQIDSFEQDKLEHYKRLNPTNLSLKLDEIKTELNKFSNLNLLKPEHCQSSQLLDTKMNLINYKLEIWINLFKNETLDFYKKIDDPNVNNLGQLISDTSDRINFKEAHCVDLSKHLRQFLNSHQEAFVIKTVLLDSTNYVIFIFENRDGFDHNLIRLMLFDENKLFKKEKILNSPDCECPIYSKGDRLCIQYLSSDTRNYLLILDNNLNELGQFETKNEKFVGVNSNYIFMQIDRIIKIYDWSYRFLNEINNQIYDYNEMFNFGKIEMFDMRNNRLFVVHSQRFREKSLKIVNQLNGKLIRKINFQILNQLCIDDDSRLILIESNRLVYFSQDGVILKQIDFVGLSLNFHICINASNNLLHSFDEDQNLVLVKKIYV